MASGNNTTRFEILHPRYFDTDLIFGINVGLLIVGLTGACFSFLAVSVILRHRKLRKRTSNKLLINLFGVDFATTLVMSAYQCLLIHNTGERMKGMGSAKDFHIMISTLMFLSIVNRITVTLDRAIAVKKPFYYHEKFNTKMAICITILQNLLALVFLSALISTNYSMDPDAHTDMMQLMFISVISVGFVVLTVSNIVVFVEAKRQIELISSISFNESNKQKQHCARKKECLIARRSICLVLLFVMCWTPFLVAICQEHMGKESMDTITVALFLVGLNYILDPIIFVSLSKDVKDHIKVNVLSVIQKHQKNAKSVPENSIQSSTTVNEKL